MSRIGKKPVHLPNGVSAVVADGVITVKGPKGELEQAIRPEVSVVVDDAKKQILVSMNKETRIANAMHGLIRALINNMVVGVTEGYCKKLEIFGTGYLAAIAGNILQVRVGFANEIHKQIPAGLEVKCPDQMHIHITGCDKQLVGQFAAEIRAIKKAEPYLGKGIKYEGEAIRRKESKAAGKK
ncbi:MAG: 50S ribosomal protein L6 [Planctomycetia bacterium]|nr:50S ribosomal protein L6 [Planctomycetia bacterium]